MRVLLLPTNIASMPSITMQALEASGVEVRAVFIDPSAFQDTGNAKVFRLKGLRFGWPHKLWNALRFYVYVLRSVIWCDVVHWCGSFGFGFLYLILPWIRLWRRPGLVEWVGSDIRVPEVEFADNPFYKAVFSNGYEYPYESKQHSDKVQRLFRWAGFRPLVFPGMEQYINPDIFPDFEHFIQRINLDSYQPNYPDPDNRKPVLVHANTAPVAKGTAYVLEAIRDLSKKYDFEFKLVQNMTRSQSLEAIRTCDIFIDQIILGSYGMAAMEAFAYGKPVVCYIKAEVEPYFPGTLPMINANPDTIREKIEELLINPGLRFQKGRESRQYAEQYHDGSKTVKVLVGIYERVVG